MFSGFYELSVKVRFKHDKLTGLNPENFGGQFEDVTNFGHFTDINYWMILAILMDAMPCMNIMSYLPHKFSRWDKFYANVIHKFERSTFHVVNL